MQELTVTSPTETMSSRELAELYGRPHNDTLKKIRRAEKAYVKVFGTEGKFSLSEYKDSTGRKLPEILLNKSQALFVAARFDPVLHARVQKRWEELEAERRDPMAALKDPAVLREMLLGYSERTLELEERQRKLAPKAEALDRIAGMDGMTCITDTAKTLQVKPSELFAWLSAHKWIYRRVGGKGWVAYQKRIQQGVLTHRILTVTDAQTGQQKVVEHVLVTPKGLARLATLLQEEEVAA